MDTQSLIPILNDPRYKGIIFDFDETIFLLKMEWDKLKKALEHEMESKFNIKVLFTPYIKASEYLKKNNPVAYKHAVSIMEQFEEEGFKKGRPNTTLLEFIRQNPEKRYGIYSMNTSRTVRLFIEKYQMEKYFSAYISQETCLGLKPSEKDLLHIAKKWRYNSNEVLYVGNSVDYDKKSGEMANIRTEIIKM